MLKERGDVASGGRESQPPQGDDHLQYLGGGGPINPPKEMIIYLGGRGPNPPKEMIIYLGGGRRPRTPVKPCVYDERRPTRGARKAAIYLARRRRKIREINDNHYVFSLFN